MHILLIKCFPYELIGYDLLYIHVGTVQVCDLLMT